MHGHHGELSDLPAHRAARDGRIQRQPHPADGSRKPLLVGGADGPVRHSPGAAGGTHTALGRRFRRVPGHAHHRRAGRQLRHAVRPGLPQDGRDQGQLWHGDVGDGEHRGDAAAAGPRTDHRRGLGLRRRATSPGPAIRWSGCASPWSFSATPTKSRLWPAPSPMPEAFSLCRPWPGSARHSSSRTPGR